MPTTKIAVAWLRKEDWPRWQAIDFELPTYNRWVTKIKFAIGEAEKKGVVVEKVTVNPDAFSKWCEEQGKSPNRAARAAYAAARLTSGGVH